MSTAILIVEDDEHKIADLIPILEESLPQASITTKRSVREAIMAVREVDHDLVVLDLSLPTFDQKASASGGTPQSQGGIEILRMLKLLGKQPRVVIVSQYFQVEIDGTYLPHSEARHILEERYNARIDAAVIYRDNSSEWADELRRFLGRLT